MKKTLHYYDIYPKVVMVNETVEITVKPLGDHVAFTGDTEIFVLSMAQGNPWTYTDRDNQTKFVLRADEDGCLRFSYLFKEESEYRVAVCRKGKEDAYLSVYALAEDMRGRYPFRGDLHMHTCRSDGSQAPAIVAANYRRHGYDFTVISDHYRYYPSLEVLDAYKDVPLEMEIVVGEEVHLPDNDIHIVNFGGKYSVNGLLENSEQNRESDRRAIIDNPPAILSEEEYRAQVNELAEKLEIPEGIEKFSYAACVWIFDHIRKAGGLGIFAHPYWISGFAYQVPENFTEFMTETHPFDAFEVLGGENYFQHNGFQTLRYYEDRARGIRYPIVGSTDSHNSLKEENRNALLCSTIVFAPKNERESLIASIKEEYSVAMDTISEEYRIVGDMRFVKYARFLLDEFFPLHDEICAEDGRWMKAYVTGDKEAEELLRFTYGRMDRMYKKYFRF